MARLVNSELERTGEEVVVT